MIHHSMEPPPNFTFLLGSMVPWNPTRVTQISTNKISGTSVAPLTTKIDADFAKEWYIMVKNNERQ